MVTPEFCLFWINSDWTCMTRSEWSGWAQAIGALVAIGIAIAVPAWQHRAGRSELERQRRDTTLRFACLALGLLLNARSLLVEARREIPELEVDRQGTAWQTLLRHVSAMVATMRSIPLDCLPGARAASELLQAIHAADDVAHTIELHGNVVAAIDYAMTHLGRAIALYEEGTVAMEIARA